MVGRIGIQTTGEIKKKLEEKAKKNNKTLSKYLIDCALKEDDTDELNDTTFALMRMEFSEVKMELKKINEENLYIKKMVHTNTYLLGQILKRYYYDSKEKVNNIFKEAWTDACSRFKK